MNLEGDSSNQAVGQDNAPVFLRRHESEQGPSNVAIPSEGAASETAASAGDRLATKDDDSRHGELAAAASSTSRPASNEPGKGKRRPIAAASGKISGDEPPVPTKKGARKTWKKPEGMPKRPLSAYNLFFRSERQLLLGENPEPGGLPGGAGGGPTAAATAAAATAKRKHRKTHGKVSFHDMANLVSERWKGMSKEDRLPFERQAALEKGRYRDELELWRVKQRIAAENVAKEVSLEKSAAAAESAERYYAAIAIATAASASASGERESETESDDTTADDDDDGSESDDDEHDGSTDEGGSNHGQLGVSGSAGLEDGVSTRGASVETGRRKSRHGDGRGKRRQREQGEAAPHAASMGQPLLVSSTSPRSETAALLVAMPNSASGAPGIVLQGLESVAPPGGALAAADPRGVSSSQPGVAGTTYAPTMTTETAMRDAAFLLRQHHAYGMTRSVAPSMPVLTSDDRQLQERYSALMAEATAVRMAMQRNQQDLGSMLGEGSVAPPSVMIPPRRHSEGIHPAAYYPMDVRRFSDNPQTLRLLRTPQPMALHQVDPSLGPHVGMPAAFEVGASLQPPLATYSTFQLPLGQAAGPSQANIEQAQLDVLALERAADLRRADIARWGQQSAPNPMALQASPAHMWAASPQAGPLPMPAAHPYPTGIQQAQYVLSNPVQQYRQAQHLQPTTRQYNQAYQPVVPQGSFSSTSFPMAHAYRAPAGSPAGTVEMVPPSISEVETAPPPAPSPLGQPPHERSF